MSLDPKTTTGSVALIVTDLDRSVHYYHDNIGLQIQHQSAHTARLGVGGRTLLQLTEQAGARPVQRGRTGLYHFAILTPSRAELSRTLHHLTATATRIDGASDHGVSEALYLSDPDGHGIEIYRDRPRAEWPISQGELQMTLDPLDARGILAESDGNESAWTGLHADTVIGHIHLHVTDLPSAEKFYVDTLGFDLMQHFGNQAAFVSAGGYHHHLGLNVWAGVGAPPPPADAARLDWYELRLPDPTALDAMVNRLEAAQIAVTQTEQGWSIRDPAQNQVVLTMS
jgi:catechol 2,3-dioxygenase